MHTCSHPDQNELPMKPHPLVTCTLFCGAVLSCVDAAPAPAASTQSTTSVQGGATLSSEFGTAARVRQLTGQLSLAEAVNLALRQNPDVLRALREIERARGRVIEVRAQALPQARARQRRLPRPTQTAMRAWPTHRRCPLPTPRHLARWPRRLSPRTSSPPSCLRLAGLAQGCSAATPLCAPSRPRASHTRRQASRRSRAAGACPRRALE